jgi:hypothetical protein
MGWEAYGSDERNGEILGRSGAAFTGKQPADGQEVIHGLRSLEQSQEIGMREVKSVCSLGR